jgi:hypothetical protein
MMDAKSGNQCADPRIGRDPGDDFLPLWVIYWNPSDFPGKHVVRRHLAGPDHNVPDRTPTAVVDTLEEARAAIPTNTINLRRFPNDDPCIVEVWV